MCKMIPEAQALEEADQALEKLKAEACQLQKRLTKDVKPSLSHAQTQESTLGSRSVELQKELQSLSARRLKATEALGQINKRQLAEIKQLTRSPPDTIRRT